MKKVILSALTAAIVLVACAPKASPTKTNSIMPAISEISSSQATIDAGHAIFTTKCTKCHGAKTNYVAKHTYDESKPVMASMVQKAKLTADEIGQLSAFLVASAKK